MSRLTLNFLAFAAGMTTMATEMSASRLLAPYFGNSLLIWANLIGLILIYLTAGYFVGGRVADRWPRAGPLYSLTLTAAAAIALAPFVAHPIMEVAVRGIEEVSAGAFLGSFGVTVLLFAVPVTILGVVPPFAIRLRLKEVETAGNVSGGLYASPPLAASWAPSCRCSCSSPGSAPATPCWCLPPCSGAFQPQAGDGGWQPARRC